MNSGWRDVSSLSLSLPLRETDERAGKRRKVARRRDGEEKEKEKKEKRERRARFARALMIVFARQDFLPPPPVATPGGG